MSLKSAPKKIKEVVRNNLEIVRNRIMNRITGALPSNAIGQIMPIGMWKESRVIDCHLHWAYTTYYRAHP